MKLTKIVTAVLLAVLICFTSVACGEDYKDAYIYVELNSRPHTLDPQLAETTEEITVTRALYDTLLRYNADGESVPSAAESYENKGLVYTFKLKSDAKWTDGTPVTAHDFVFALRRAVNPETVAPLASSLFCIKGAKAINNRSADVSTLGVFAENDYTLKIELERQDPEFLKVLTMPITAPCNREIFENAKGKYGLTVDTTASNGSYYVRIWNTADKFLLRLAKNLDFKGEFEANSMRVYFTCSEKDAIYLLENDNTDLSFITTEEYPSVSSAGFEVERTEDTCYVMFINQNIDRSVRAALLTSVDRKGISNSLGDVYRPADTFFPSALSLKGIKSVDSYIIHDENSAKQMYLNSALNTENKSTLTIGYPSDPVIRSVSKSIAAHWQQTLSCFVNIEEKQESQLKQGYSYGGYDIIILPVSSVAGITASYTSKFLSENIEPISLQENLFGEYLCYPICYSSTNIGADKKMKNLKSSTHDGIVDVSQLIKMQ
ncbi:MAG: hypothetical protein J6Q56_01000 [Clostridia bacterium]|nr:hypothetical protein [Clostridia bacterium]